MSTHASEPLLPRGIETSFAGIDAAFAQVGHGQRLRHPRGLTATVIVIGPRERLLEATDALEHLVGVRAILIAEGAETAPTVRVTDYAIAIDGLRGDYINNAVAALRLSSLPSLAWWRGGASASLEGLADLADRLVLDTADPQAGWNHARTLLDRAAFTDLRWTRLTRWRALMAHLMDIPEVRDAAASMTALRVDAGDAHLAHLFVAWLRSSLEWGGKLTVDVRNAPGGAPLEAVHLGNGRQGLTLRLMPGRTCIEAVASVDGRPGASQTVSLGDQGLAALINEELRIRARDVAFEKALAALDPAG
ncbi:MAG: glucose-6-phosphate dehydrogenase assembly protein OpcA [Acidobacteria bacterium]|nr:glucose-6-phosphate dehydrogenase assembly protein OpcA [Acidobacteriota bacterium]MCA1649701.1 glucose-6-phosphate dehydrogenase assembly protein OpcA [Acidobacteriota bacterium]